MYFGRNRRGLPLIYNTHQPLQYNRPLQLENQIKAAESYSRVALCKGGSNFLILWMKSL